MNILGISCFRDDAAAALLVDGAIAGIAEEERYLRVKHAVYEPRTRFATSFDEDEAPDGFELRFFPDRAIASVLAEAGLELSDVDVVAHDFVYERRIAELGRFRPLAGLLGPDELDRQVRAWRYWNRVLEGLAAEAGAELVHVPHHEAHASGTVFGSGFGEGAFLVADGLGELESMTWGTFERGSLRTLRTVDLPVSLGLLYAAVTAYLGFRPFSGEQQTMGLAAYGQPRYAGRLRDVVGDLDPDRFRDEYVWTDAIKMGSDRPSRLHELFDAPPRPADVPATTAPYPDVAASLQHVLEEIVVDRVRALLGSAAGGNLALSGGVALNCSMNGRVAQLEEVGELYVQPQAGDSGTALGAAYAVHHRRTGSMPEPLTHVYWGQGFSASDVHRVLRDRRIAFDRPADLEGTVADLLADGAVVGWFQGRAECGPRALGARSILADPSRPGTADHVNGRIKDRERWRPFAASVLATRADRYLRLDQPAPFMLVAAPLTERGRRELAEASHVDGTTRPQVVTAVTNPRYHRLIERFERRTGIGAVLNTSFNLRHEPIVNTPEEALADFYLSALDALAIEDVLLVKDGWEPAHRDQPPHHDQPPHPGGDR